MSELFVFLDFSSCLMLVWGLILLIYSYRHLFYKRCLFIKQFNEIGKSIVFDFIKLTKEHLVFKNDE